MKKHTYILILVVLINIPGCTEDARLPEYTDIELKVTAQAGNDFIDLNGDITCKERKIEERGFLLTRTWLSDHEWEKPKKHEEKIIVPSESDFKVHIADSYGDPMEFEVFAYAKIDGRLYRSQSIIFNAERNTPASITSVKIEPGINNVEGDITIEGQNFSIFSSKSYLEVDTLLHGFCTIDAKECTSERLIFHYACYNIGSFPLLFKKDQQEIRLTQRLQIKGPQIQGFIPEHPIAGEWTEIILTDVASNFQFGCRMTGMDMGLKQTDGKLYVAFQYMPEKTDIQLYYSHDRHEIYLPTAQICFSHPWEKIDHLSQFVDFQTISDGKAYTFSENELYCYSFKDMTLEKYQLPFDTEWYPWDMWTQGTCIMEDYVYVCFATYTLPADRDKRLHDIGIVRFNLKTKQWEFYDKLPISLSSSFSITTCEDYLVIKERSSYANQVIIYHPNEKNWKSYSDMTVWNISWIGSNKGYFYYFENATGSSIIKRIKIGEWKEAEEVYRFPTTYSWLAWINQAYIENDYLYMLGGHAMRMKLSADPAIVEPLGSPLNANIQSILPTSDNLYCIDNKGSIYRYAKGLQE